LLLREAEASSHQHRDRSPRPLAARASPSVAGTAPLTYGVHRLHVIHKVSLPQVDGELAAAHGGRKEGHRLVFAIELANIFKP